MLRCRLHVPSLSSYGLMTTTDDRLLQLLLRSVSPRGLPDVQLKLAESGRHDALRASALPFCARRWSLATWLPPLEQPHPRVSLVNKATTAAGTVVHALIQHWLHRLLWGHWRCPRCGLLRKGVQWSRRLRCRNEGCGSRGRDLCYVEVELQHPTLPLTGHPDGVLWLPGESRPLLLEIKTIDAEHLQDLTEPLPQHLNYQASAYGQLFRLSRFSLHLREVIFLYISRNLPFTHSVWWSNDGESLLASLTTHSTYNARPLVKLFRRPLMLATATKEFTLIEQALHAGESQPLLAPQWRRCADVDAASQTFCPYRFICFSSCLDSIVRRNQQRQLRLRATLRR